MSNSEIADPLKTRTADHPIEELFLKRWSPRAMAGEAVSDSDLMRLFEAARWAPSTYNEQEWRYLYAARDTEHWSTFFGLLVEANQHWCQNAGVLVVVCSSTKFAKNGKDNPVHSFDAGASFENLALQGAAMGLVIHPMAGFDADAARQQLNIPDDYHVDAMIAIGQPAPPSVLPADLANLEQPTGRKTVAEISCEGPFGF